MCIKLSNHIFHFQSIGTFMSWQLTIKGEVKTPYGVAEVDFIDAKEPIMVMLFFVCRISTSYIHLNWGSRFPVINNSLVGDTHAPRRTCIDRACGICSTLN